MNSNKTAIIILSVVFVIIVSIVSWYFFSYKPAQEAKERARQEQIKKQEEEEQRQRVLLEQKKSRYEDLIEKADAEWEQGNWEAAQSLYAQASALMPNQQYAKDQLAAANAKLQEIADQQAKVSAGIIEQISEAPNLYHVIVSSSIDDDLAMDYAKKLAEQGYNVKLLEHNTGTHVYFRVCVGDYSSKEEAESAKSNFSMLEGDLWVLRY